MATLLDRLKKNRSTVKTGSGPLQETSKEELQSLAQQSGMPSTPSTPLSAEGIGATPDQAKMLGTPAQQQGAVRMQVREQDQLSTAQRQEQARKQSTAEEQAAQARALKFEGLGSLGDRVQQIAAGMLNQAATGQNLTQRVLTANTDRVKETLTPQADEQQTIALLNKLGSNSITDQEMIQLAGNLGYTNVSDIPQLKDTVKSQFLTETEQTGQFIAERIGDNVTVSQLTGPQLQELGFASIEDFAAALQVDPQALQGMTLRQLQDTFGKERLEDFGKAQAAQAVIADPNASRAMKEQALKELKELGATGVRAAESDVRKIEEQVQNASTVQFGGEEYSVEELLKDDTVSGIVKQYLTDPEVAKQLKASEPAFALWIEQNKKILAGAAADVDARQEQFAKVQLDNMSIGKNLEVGGQPVGNLSEDTLKTLFPDYGKLTVEKYQEPAFLKMIKDEMIPTDTAAQMVAAANELAQIDPKYVQDLAGLSIDEINSLGLNTKEAISNYRNYVQDTNDLIRAPVEEIPERVTGRSEEELADLTDMYRAINALGMGLDIRVSEIGLIDSDKDGVPNTPEQMKEVYLSTRGGLGEKGALTVREMLDRGVKTGALQNGMEQVNTISAAISSKANSEAFSRFGKYYRGDGTFTDSDANDVLSNQLRSIQDFKAVDNLTGNGNMSTTLRQKLDSGLTNFATNEINKRIQNAAAVGSYQDIQNVLNAGNQGNMGSNRPRVQEALSVVRALKGDGNYQNPRFQKVIQQREAEIVKQLKTDAATAWLKGQGPTPPGVIRPNFYFKFDNNGNMVDWVSRPFYDATIPEGFEPSGSSAISSTGPSPFDTGKIT